MMWWSMHRGWMTWMRFPLIVNNPLDKTCQCKHVVVNLPFFAVNPLEQKGKTWPNPRVWCHFNGHGLCLIVETQDTPFPNHYIESYIIFDNLYDQIHDEWYSWSAKMWPTSIPLWVCRIFWDSCQTWWAPGFFLCWVFLVFVGKIEQTMQTFSLYSNFNLYLTETVMLGLLHDASDMFCLQQSI